MYCILIFLTLDSVFLHDTSGGPFFVSRFQKKDADVGTSVDTTTTPRTDDANGRRERTRWKTKENDADDARADDRDEW